MLFITSGLILLTFSGTAAYALQPPYSSPSFDNENDLLESLKMYIEYYPYKDECRKGCHVEQRRIIVPKIADPDYYMESCNYADAYWGSGVNYAFFEFLSDNPEQLNTGYMPQRIGILIYYYNPNIKISTGSKYKSPYEKAKITKGTYKGIPYYACNYKQKNGEEYSRYNLMYGDILIDVYDSWPFTENRIDLISFEETEILLPVFIKENNISPVLFWASGGIVFIAIIFIGSKIWIKRFKARNIDKTPKIS